MVYVCINFNFLKKTASMNRWNFWINIFTIGTQKKFVIGYLFEKIC